LEPELDEDDFLDDDDDESDDFLLDDELELELLLRRLSSLSLSFLSLPYS
jgi:hypothetical protein